MLGTEILDSLLYYVIIFPSSSQNWPPDHRQGNSAGAGSLAAGIPPCSCWTDCSKAGYSGPGGPEPDCSRSGCSKTDCSSSDCSAWGYSRSGYPTWAGFKSSPSTPLMVGIEARVFCCCWALLKKKNGLTEKVLGSSELSVVGIACCSNRRN